MGEKYKEINAYIQKVEDSDKIIDKENEAFEKPNWLGKEVTNDNRYYNSYLSKFPYSTWR